MSAASPRLSVIIVNANTRHWLQGCLDSLRCQAIFAELEVVVVDNASTDGSVAMLRENYPECRLLALEENLGFGAGNNAGARLCQAPVLLFLNPDTVVGEGALEEVLDFLETHPQCGVVGGRIVDGDGEVEHSAGALPTLSSLVLDRFLKGFPGAAGALEGRAHHHRFFEVSRPVDWVTGAYLWIRRALFEQIGGFDRALFMYYEDVDLCYRARRAGSGAFFFPGGTIVHYRNKAPVPSRSRKQMQRRSLCQFAAKHYRSPRFWPLRAALRLMLYM